jgi:tetratricopeptide (TPR) repeat protein
MKVGNSARQRPGRAEVFLVTAGQNAWGVLRVAPIILALLLSQFRLASAQEVTRPQLSDAQKQKTKEHYEKATRLYNVGKYQEAVGEYEAAYLVSADPVMLFNIAQCHRLANQPDEAARFYKNYLRNAPGAPNRDDVERKIAEMERLSEERRRAGTPSVQPAQPTPPPVSPTPGPMPAGPASPPPLDTGAPPAATTSPGEPSIVAESAPPRRSRVLPYTMLISSGVLLATSVLFGAVAASKAQQIEDRAKAQMPIFDTGAKKIQDDGKAASGVAVVTGLAGLAAGGVGLFFLLRSPGSSEAAAADSTGGTTARAGTAVFPVVGDGTWGAGARFSF